MELTLATINDDKLRQTLPFFETPTVSAIDDFLHGSVIVGTFHSLDVEMTVAALVWLRIDKLHHGSDRIIALEVGIVETLYDLRQDRHPQIVFQLIQHPLLMTFGVGQGTLFVEVNLILCRIATRQLQQ